MGQLHTVFNPMSTDCTKNLGFGLSGPAEVSVLTFNILADAYSRFHDYCSSKYLQFQYRADLIFSMIRSSQVDFVCLQEVDTYESHFKAFLESEGYSSQYIKRPSHYNPDGSLIAWKSDRWEVLEMRMIDYNDHEKCKINSAYKKNNVGLVIAFEEKSSKRRIVVGTSHFFWNPTYEYVKFLQGKIFCSIGKEFKEKYQCPIILTGDLNSEPFSSTVKYLLGQELDLQAGDQISNEILTMAEKNDLELQSAYSGYFEGGHPEFTNYTRDYKGCLDYIFHSAELTVKNLGNVPTSKDFQHLVGIPNQEFPSDHLPLSAKFLFT